MNAVLSVLPARLLPHFARGAAGRRPDDQPPSLPPTVSIGLAQPHPDPSLATWVFLSRKPVSGVSTVTMRSLLASPRFNDQLVGARLLVAPNVEPPFELIEYLQPIPMATAFKSIARRNSTIPNHWHRWIDSVALRVRSNLRAWGNTWLALTSEAPKTDPEVRAALLTALSSLATVTAGDAGVDAAFRCSNASLLASLTGIQTPIASCADEAHSWRSMLARVNFVRERPADPDRAAILAQILHDAAGDPRILEALPDVVVMLPPGMARPILQELAEIRDPGVLATLLGALALHVQHARSLPSSQRERLIRAPFSLDEAVSLEARQQAIALARALNVAVPAAVSVVRAMQQAANPDASVAPARTPERENTERGSLIVTTTRGRIVIAVTADSAPQAARTVIEAARGGRYNGTTFHRVVPAFVVQGGDPRGDGYGGNSEVVPTELSGMPFNRGAVGIALAGLDTGGMQFFVVTADAPHLDARYPWIGHVVEGLELVDELMEGDTIERVEFAER